MMPDRALGGMEIEEEEMGPKEFRILRTRHDPPPPEGTVS